MMEARKAKIAKLIDELGELHQEFREKFHKGNDKELADIARKLCEKTEELIELCPPATEPLR